MFDIEFSKEAEKDIKALGRKNAEIIIKKIYSIRENPLHYLERLAGLSLWKLRIGDYRAIIQINTTSNKLFIIKIGHRKNIYKTLKD